jgi:dihydropteroate synthase
VFNGADIIRTHDVMETLDAIKIACYLRRQIK